MEQNVKKGVFYGVGIGPGDPELLTLKAVRVLEMCAVIAAPQTKNGETMALEIAGKAVDFTGKTVLPLQFIMDRDPEPLHTAHMAAADAVEAYLASGQDVAMLNLGDVSIYATCGYLTAILAERGYETAMIPGVPSFCAVAARLGISLTEMDGALHIAPGSGELDTILAQRGTKILMKSGKQIPAVLKALRKSGRLDKSMLVKNCGLAGEEVYPNLARTAPKGNTGYFAIVIVKE